MTRPEILDNARKCVCGDREEDYGSPEDNFARIAGLWSAYLGVPIRVWDVAALLALLKLGRIGGGQVKLDNWIDLAGYAACGGEIQSAEADAAMAAAQPEPERKVEVEFHEIGSGGVQVYSPCTIVTYPDDSWDWFRPDEEVVERPDSFPTARYDNCAVELISLKNGTVSRGWWHIDTPPVNLGSAEDFWNED